MFEFFMFFKAGLGSHNFTHSMEGKVFLLGTLANTTHIIILSHIYFQTMEKRRHDILALLLKTLQRQRE